ncbi:MAG: hypothetical protein AB1634_14910 [Thermodesulfobacteriota bacterium]
MHDWLYRWRPAVAPRTHLFLAALGWSLVGLMLLGRGLTALLAWEGHRLLPFLAVLAGLAKARWVLARSARRIAARIVQFGSPHCIGAVYSWQSWLLVAAMIGLGRLLRLSPLPRIVVGTLFTAVGTGLLAASVVLWRQWRQIS